MSSLGDVIFARLLARIEHLERLVARQQMRINNLAREAKVLEVDPSTGLAIVDANGVQSKPIPWLQHAGDIVDWEPPSVGQRMLMISPNGELGNGFLLPGGFTDSVPKPYSEGAMFGRTIGQTVISGADGTYDIQTGTFRITANVEIAGNVTITGDTLTHNSKNVGDTHGHTNVVNGPAISGPPA